MESSCFVTKLETYAIGNEVYGNSLLEIYANGKGRVKRNNMNFQ